MVVRIFLASMVYNMPIVGNLVPDIIAQHLSPIQEIQEKPQDSDPDSINKEAINVDFGNAQSNTKIKDTKPIPVNTSKRRILNSILSKRKSNNIGYLNTDTDDYIIDLQPINKLSRIESEKGDESIPEISTYQKPESSQTNPNKFLTYSSVNSEYNGKAPTFLNIKSFNDENSSNSSQITTNQTVERYLDDQHQKFDELINRNLDNVLEPHASTVTSKSIKVAKNVASYGWKVMNSIFTSSNPAIQPSSPCTSSSSTQDTLVELSSDTSSNVKFNQLDIYKNSAIQVGEMLAISLDDYLPISFNENSLSDVEFIRYLLQEMPQDNKYQLYELLREEMEEFEDAKDRFLPSSSSSLSSSSSPSSSFDHLSSISHKNSRTENSTIDKIQSLILLSVKLGFIALKLSIPISIWLFTKFSTNQLYILNKKNANKILELSIKILGEVEKRVNSSNNTFLNQDGIIKSDNTGYSVSQSNYVSTSNNIRNCEKENGLNAIFNDFANGSSDFINAQIASRFSNSWKGKLIHLLLVNELGGKNSEKNSVEDNKNDPRYSQYFAKGEKGRTEYRNNSDGIEDVNLLRAAEIFVRQLE